MGGCSAKLQVGAHRLTGAFIIVDIPSKHPLLGRDLLTKIGITLDMLLKQDSVKPIALKQTYVEEEQSILICSKSNWV